MKAKEGVNFLTPHVNLMLEVYRIVLFYPNDVEPFELAHHQESYLNN